MYEIVFHPQAQKEYLEACNWYEQKRIGLGSKFKFFVLNQIELIIEDPEIYPTKKRKYRECNIQKFPYIIVYSIDSQQNVITVAAIYHTSRNSKRKYRK